VQETKIHGEFEQSQALLISADYVEKSFEKKIRPEFWRVSAEQASNL